MGKLTRRLTHEAMIAEFVSPGAHVALGGLHFHNTPMVLVRELIRQGVYLGCLTPPLDGSVNADMLIGAGLVAEVQVAYLGAEIYGLAPRFRAAAEARSIRVRDMEEAGYTLAVEAGAAGLPFAALPEGFLPHEGDIPTVASVNPQDYQRVLDPFSGAEVGVVRAIKPDVTLVHCQLVDEQGNCGFRGAPFLDLALARAADTCLVHAERAVETLPANCRAVLPGYVVDAVSVLEGGAHPGSSHGCYAHDDTLLRQYIAAAASAEGYARYQRKVIGPSEAAYREAVDIHARLGLLERDPP